MLRAVRLLGLGALLAAVGSVEGAPAKAPAAPKAVQVADVKPEPDANDLKVEPASIWPAGLEKLAGRYTYVQVASPGGLWEAFPGHRKQISIDDLSAESQGRLRSAEIVISGLRGPSKVEASERVSPSKRGKLRYYEESADGRLVVRHLPGIAGSDGNEGDFSGPVTFTLIHNSHSNPSILGVFQTRLQQESTWGAATLDYADLGATPLVADAKPDQELPAAIANARVLRSGVEIFAFVNWTEKRADAEHVFTGAVRLSKQRAAAPSPAGK
jgi:hypothetical protein